MTQTNLDQEILRIILEEVEKELNQTDKPKSRRNSIIATLTAKSKSWRNSIIATLAAMMIGTSGAAIQKEIDKGTIKKIERQIINVSTNRQSIVVLPDMHKRLLDNPEAFIISDGKYGSKNTIVVSVADLISKIKGKSSNIAPEQQDQAEKYLATITDLSNQKLISIMPPSLSVAYIAWEDKLEGKKPRFDLTRNDIELVKKGLSVSSGKGKQVKINSDKAVDQIRKLYYEHADKILTQSRISDGDEQEENLYIEMPNDLIVTKKGLYETQSYMIDPDFLIKEKKDYVLPENGLTVEQQYKLYYLQYLTVEDLEAIQQQNEEGSEQFDIAVEIFKNSTGLEKLEQRLKSYGDENLPPEEEYENNPNNPFIVKEEYKNNPNSTLIVKSPLQEMVRKKFFFVV